MLSLNKLVIFKHIMINKITSNVLLFSVLLIFFTIVQSKTIHTIYSTPGYHTITPSDYNFSENITVVMLKDGSMVNVSMPSRLQTFDLVNGALIDCNILECHCMTTFIGNETKYHIKMDNIVMNLFNDFEYIDTYYCTSMGLCGGSKLVTTDVCSSMVNIYYKNVNVDINKNKTFYGADDDEFGDIILIDQMYKDYFGKIINQLQEIDLQLKIGVCLVVMYILLVCVF